MPAILSFSVSCNSSKLYAEDDDYDAFTDTVCHYGDYCLSIVDGANFYCCSLASGTVSSSNPPI